MEVSEYAVKAEVADFKEIPAALGALEETIASLASEWTDLERTLIPVCAPPADEKMAEELRIGPSSEVATTLHAMEARVARLRNSIYDVRRRVQL